jgi:type VI secretion system protein ImpJ
MAQLLDEITAGPDHVISLRPEEGLYCAEMKPALFEGKNRFYLAVTGDDDMKKSLAAVESAAKLSSRSHIDVLLSHALPGIPLQHLVAPPQELPRRANVLYFAIDAFHDQWAQVKRERRLAFLWDGAPESLKVELMAVGR